MIFIILHKKELIFLTFLRKNINNKRMRHRHRTPSRSPRMRSPYGRNPPMRSPPREEVRRTPPRDQEMRRREEVRNRHPHPRERAYDSRSRSRSDNRSKSPYSFNKSAVTLPKSRNIVQNNFNRDRKVRNYNAKPPSNKSGFESGIWEQWNFERKMDQAPRITKKAPERYYSSPHHLNNDPKFWSGELKREVFDELMRNVTLMNMAAGSSFNGGFEPIAPHHQRNLDAMLQRLSNNGGTRNNNYNNGFEGFDYYERGNPCMCGSGCSGPCRTMAGGGNFFQRQNSMRNNPRFANFNNNNRNLTPPPLNPLYGNTFANRNSVMVRAGNHREINDIGRSNISRNTPQRPVAQSSYHIPQKSQIEASSMNVSRVGSRYKNSQISNHQNNTERPYGLSGHHQEVVRSPREMERSDIRTRRVTPERRVERSFRERDSFYDPRGRESNFIDERRMRVSRSPRDRDLHRDRDRMSRSRERGYYY